LTNWIDYYTRWNSELNFCRFYYKYSIHLKYQQISSLILLISQTVLLQRDLSLLHGNTGKCTLYWVVTIGSVISSIPNHPVYLLALTKYHCYLWRWDPLDCSENRKPIAISYLFWTVASAQTTSVHVLMDCNYCALRAHLQSIDYSTCTVFLS
jgi:hypothetical protein